MQGLLSHPAVQGGLAPFVVALIVAELLQRLRLSGLAIVAGFAVTVYLVSDFSIEPLTAVRKMVLLGLLAAPLALVLIRSNWPPLRWILTVLGGVAGAWVVSHILQQQDLSHALLLGSGCAVYVGWQIFWMDTLRDSPARAGSAGMALGLGTGGSALLGAVGFARAAQPVLGRCRWGLPITASGGEQSPALRANLHLATGYHCGRVRMSCRAHRAAAVVRAARAGSDPTARQDSGLKSDGATVAIVCTVLAYHGLCGGCHLHGLVCGGCAAPVVFNTGGGL